MSNVQNLKKEDYREISESSQVDKFMKTFINIASLIVQVF